MNKKKRISQNSFWLRFVFLRIKLLGWSKSSFKRCYGKTQMNLLANPILCTFYNNTLWNSGSADINQPDIILLDPSYKYDNTPPHPDLGHIGCFQVSPTVQFSSVQSLSRVQLFVTPWIAARQASLSITNSRNSLRHVHRVSDAIQPSHPLSSPSLPAPNNTLISCTVAYDMVDF